MNLPSKSFDPASTLVKNAICPLSIVPKSDNQCNPLNSRMKMVSGEEMREYDGYFTKAIDAEVSNVIGEPYNQIKRINKKFYFAPHSLEPSHPELQHQVIKTVEALKNSVPISGSSTKDNKKIKRIIRVTRKTLKEKHGSLIAAIYKEEKIYRVGFELLRRAAAAFDPVVIVQEKIYLDDNTENNDTKNIRTEVYRDKDNREYTYNVSIGIAQARPWASGILPFWVKVCSQASKTDDYIRIEPGHLCKPILEQKGNHKNSSKIIHINNQEKSTASRPSTRVFVVDPSVFAE